MFWVSQFIKHLISWQYSVIVAGLMMLARPTLKQTGRRLTHSSVDDVDPEVAEPDFDWTVRTKPSQLHALGAVAESSFWCGANGM